MIDRAVRNQRTDGGRTDRSSFGVQGGFSHEDRALLQSYGDRALRDIFVDIVRNGNKGEDIRDRDAARQFRAETGIQRALLVVHSFVDEDTIFRYDGRGTTFFSLSSPDERAQRPPPQSENGVIKPFNIYKARFAADILEVLAENNEALTKNELLARMPYKMDEWELGRLLERMVRRGYVVLESRNPKMVTRIASVAILKKAQRDHDTLVRDMMDGWMPRSLPEGK